MYVRSARGCEDSNTQHSSGLQSHEWTHPLFLVSFRSYSTLILLLLITFSSHLAVSTNIFSNALRYLIFQLVDFLDFSYFCSENGAVNGGKINQIEGIGKEGNTKIIYCNYIMVKYNLNFSNNIFLKKCDQHCSSCGSPKHFVTECPQVLIILFCNYRICNYHESRKDYTKCVQQILYYDAGLEIQSQVSIRRISKLLRYEIIMDEHCVYIVLIRSASLLEHHASRISFDQKMTQ